MISNVSPLPVDLDRRGCAHSILTNLEIKQHMITVERVAWVTYDAEMNTPSGWEWTIWDQFEVSEDHNFLIEFENTASFLRRTLEREIYAGLELRDFRFLYQNRSYYFDNWEDLDLFLLVGREVKSKPDVNFALRNLVGQTNPDSAEVFQPTQSDTVPQGTQQKKGKHPIRHLVDSAASILCSTPESESVVVVLDSEDLYLHYRAQAEHDGVEFCEECLQQSYLYQALHNGECVCNECVKDFYNHGILTGYCQGCQIAFPLRDQNLCRYHFPHLVDVIETRPALPEEYSNTIANISRIEELQLETHEFAKKHNMKMEYATMAQLQLLRGWIDRSRNEISKLIRIADPALLTLQQEFGHDIGPIRLLAEVLERLTQLNADLNVNPPPRRICDQCGAMRPENEMRRVGQTEFYCLGPHQTEEMF